MASMAASTESRGGTRLENEDLPPPPTASTIAMKTEIGANTGPFKSATAGRTKAPGTKIAPPRPPSLASTQMKPAGSVHKMHAPGKTVRSTPVSRQVGAGTSGRRGRAVTRLGYGGAERVRTPVRRAAVGGGGAEGGMVAAQQTPRQAAIAAKKQLTEQKQREGAALKQQQEEMKSAAKVRQAESMAEQQRALRVRADKAQRQRLAAAAAKKAVKERQAETKARELQAKMDERKELKEDLEKQEKERRRNSVAHKNALWSRERDLKQRQREARQHEQQMLLEEHNVYREAKHQVKEEEELADKQELVWRARRGYLHKQLDAGAGYAVAYEAWQARRDRRLDQMALEEAAMEEKRLRRSSAQWGRNKKFLEGEIERGMGKALDPFKLADDLYQREESRNEDREFREAQKQLRRESRQRRRRSDMRRKGVQEAMGQREKELEADLKASRDEGMQDTAAYREACLRRERESLDGRRQAFHDQKELDLRGKEFDDELRVEERDLIDLYRQDHQAYVRRLGEDRRAEEEYRRQDSMRDRLYREELELERKEREAKERRILLEDRESVSVSKRKEEEAEMDRREALREPPSERTKLEILEAIWARQSHPAAAAAARGRRRLTMRTVEEVDSESDLGTSDVGTSRGCNSSSSSSGMGIKGRLSDCSSFDSLLVGWKERESAVADEEVSKLSESNALMIAGHSTIGLGGNVRLEEEEEKMEFGGGWRGPGVSPAGVSPAGEEEDGGEGGGAAPAWGDVSVIEQNHEGAMIHAMTASAAAVLAHANQSFGDDSSDYEDVVDVSAADGSSVVDVSAVEDVSSAVDVSAASSGSVTAAFAEGDSGEMEEDGGGGHCSGNDRPVARELVFPPPADEVGSKATEGVIEDYEEPEGIDDEEELGRDGGAGEEPSCGGVDGREGGEGGCGIDTDETTVSREDEASLELQETTLESDDCCRSGGDGDDTSGVLMMSRTDPAAAGVGGADISEIVDVSLGVISVEDGDESGDTGGGGGGRKSYVFGSRNATGSRDGALASLDGNKGSPSDLVEDDIDGVSVGAEREEETGATCEVPGFVVDGKGRQEEGEDFGVSTPSKAVGGRGDAIAAATPITPDEG